MAENPVERVKSFEEKMKDRIKDGIGDLLSDEEVKKLIDRGMEEVFFKSRSTPNPRGYGDPVTKPCLLHEILIEVLQPVVTQIVKDYVADHQEEVNGIIGNVVQQGLGNALMQAVNLTFMSSLINFQNNVQQDIANKIQRI